MVPDASLIERCRAYAPRLAPWQFFSHETALALLGVPTPDWPYSVRIHVSAHRPAREPRTSGVTGHRLQVREPATITSPQGFPVEHPVRAWRQTAGLWGLDDLIVAADALLSGPAPLAEIGDLREEIALMGDSRSHVLTRALREARIGVRSPRESVLRLVLVRAGLPEPLLNWPLHDADGEFVAELDLAYPQWRVAPEYDGRIHAEDARQFAKDADRWDRIRRAGWNHVRCMNHHLRPSTAPAIARVQEALIAGGWRPAGR